MNKPPFQETAQKIFTTRYSDAAVMFLAGSVVRGEGTKTSDLDLVVVFDHLDRGVS